VNTIALHKVDPSWLPAEKKPTVVISRLCNTAGAVAVAVGVVGTTAAKKVAQSAAIK
jgi:hypothetical protein